MLSLKHQSVLFSILLLSCTMLLPAVQGRGNNNDDHGLAVMLAAGLLAKLLKHNKKHEIHHVHIPVPVHHDEHHHHGSGSARMPVHYPAPSAQMPVHYPAPSARMPVHYPAPFQHLYGGPMVGAHSYPRHVVYTPPVARHPPHVPCPYKD